MAEDGGSGAALGRIANTVSSSKLPTNWHCLGRSDYSHVWSNINQTLGRLTTTSAGRMIGEESDAKTNSTKGSVIGAFRYFVACSGLGLRFKVALQKQTGTPPGTATRSALLQGANNTRHPSARAYGRKARASWCIDLFECLGVPSVRRCAVRTSSVRRHSSHASMGVRERASQVLPNDVDAQAP